MKRTGQLNRKTPLSARKPMQKARRKPSKAAQKDTRWRSEAYLAWVRSLPCCVCGATTGIAAHHLVGMWQVSGMGLKAPDSFAMPACDPIYGHGRDCHQQIHRLKALRRRRAGAHHRPEIRQREAPLRSAPDWPAAFARGSHPGAHHRCQKINETKHRLGIYSRRSERYSIYRFTKHGKSKNDHRQKLQRLVCRKRSQADPLLPRRMPGVPARDSFLVFTYSRTNATMYLYIHRSRGNVKEAKKACDFPVA